MTKNPFLNYFKKQRRRRKLPLTLSLILLGVFLLIYVFTPSIPNKNSFKKLDKPVSNVAKPYLSITPAIIQQGEPALITVEGLNSISTIKSFTINNIPLAMFLHKGQVTALVGVDLRTISETLPVVLTFTDGKQLRENLIVKERPVIKELFNIPNKLGGNTPESEKALISSLADEAKIINALPTSNKKLWNEPFELPLKNSIVGDPYGYTRLTVKSTIPHKGVDLKADIGTPVYAMNQGVIIYASYLRNYGNTVVIDHGLGLQTAYLHLSEINVTENQTLEKGELIGLSGDTGYVLGPHLHLSVKIWDISIDPIKFLELLGSKN